MKPLPSAIEFSAISLLSAALLPAMAIAATSSVDTLVQKLRDEPGERADAGKRLETFLLAPDSAGKRFVSSSTDQAALGRLARGWAEKAESRRLAALLIASTPASPSEARLRAALVAWTAGLQIQRTS